MRYLEITLNKAIRVAVLALLLFTSVVLTYVWRAATFGSTPLVGSAQSAAEEAAVWVTFGAYHLARSVALSGYPAEASAGASADAVPVLTYHRLTLWDDGSNVSVTTFAHQMQTLYERGWRTISLAEYQEFMAGKRSLPARSFLLTFDDGAQESYYPADPILAILGFRAVEYVIVAASLIEGSNYYLSPEQIRAMLATGRWEIGGHSYDAHRPYVVDAAGHTGLFYADKLWLAGAGRLEADEEFRTRVDDDLAHARVALESMYGVTIETMAFPFGLESGIASAENYPAGTSVTVDVASQHYMIGWMQTTRQDFTYDYPGWPSFVQMRIHVDHDWDGAKLLSFLEGGLPKQLPFADTMETDAGWRNSWGAVYAGGKLQLHALPGETSASSVLDGSRLWQHYGFTATTTWQDGAVFLLGNLTESRTYRSCAFSAGRVAIDDTVAGTDTTLARAFDASIIPGERSLGMRIEPGLITCLYEGRPVLTTAIESRAGGIGVQTWNSARGTASSTVSGIMVSPL